MVVATDDERIAEAVRGYPLTVCMTAPRPSLRHRSPGRVRAAAGLARRSQIVVNLQGDEPFAPAGRHPRRGADPGRSPSAEWRRWRRRIDDCETLFDPNAVKVVRDAQRAGAVLQPRADPWQRDRFAQRPGQRAAAGRACAISASTPIAPASCAFARLPPGALEQAEALEQLRVLEAGHRIAVGLSPVPFPPGVDTEADLQRAEARMSA